MIGTLIALGILAGGVWLALEVTASREEAGDDLPVPLPKRPAAEPLPPAEAAADDAAAAFAALSALRGHLAALGHGREAIEPHVVALGTLIVRTPPEEPTP